MTYRELLQEIQRFTETQLNQPVTIHLHSTDEFYSTVEIGVDTDSGQNNEAQEPQLVLMIP